MAHGQLLIYCSILNGAEKSITKTQNNIDRIWRRETRKADRNERDTRIIKSGGKGV